MESFGTTVRRLRKERGLLLREVAALLEVDPSFLSRIEKNVKSAAKEHVVRLAGDPRYSSLLLRHPDEFLLYATPFRYLRSINALSPDGHSALQRVLRMQSMWSVERPPHRMLELWNFCQACEEDTHGIEVDAVVFHELVQGFARNPAEARAGNSARRVCGMRVRGLKEQ